MRIVALHLLATVALGIVGCDDETSSGKTPQVSVLADEETAGLAILTQYATHLIGEEGFPDLDPYQPSAEESVFRNSLKEACPNAMDAEVEIGRNGYSIGPQPIELIAGDGTNHVNTRVVRSLSTPGVVGHNEVEFEYTTLDGKSGSIPATQLVVDRVIKGQKVRLRLSTKRTQHAASGDGEKPPN